MAAPQLTRPVTRAAAVVQPAESGAGPIVLLTPRVTDVSGESDEQYEGCLSFFDVRGQVPRPLRITVETTSLNGATVTTVYQRGLARLVQHEIDHLDGLLYTDRMRSGVLPIHDRPVMGVRLLTQRATSDYGRRERRGPSHLGRTVCPRLGCMAAAVRTATTTARRKIRQPHRDGDFWKISNSPIVVNLTEAPICRRTLGSARWPR
nr:peptide deformylase [Streptomyces lasalocidi]